MFLCFLTEDGFLPILCVYYEYVQKFEGGLTLRHHTKTVGTLFLYQWKEKTHSYTLVADIRV